MRKIGVIGDRESVLGFSALGLDIFPVLEASEATELLESKEALEYAILFITEELALPCKEAIDLHRASKTPAVILIPSKKGSLGIGISNVGKRVEKAVGADILFKEN